MRFARGSLWTATILAVFFAATELRATCITVYGSEPNDVECSLLEPQGKWVSVRSPGSILLFKNIWGKGKRGGDDDSDGSKVAPPKHAGVGLAGPLCWAGAPPVLDLVPTTPVDRDGDAWTVPQLTDWQAVKTGGFCQICCTAAFSAPPGPTPTECGDTTAPLCDGSCPDGEVCNTGFISSTCRCVQGTTPCNGDLEPSMCLEGACGDEPGATCVFNSGSPLGCGCVIN